MKEFSTDEYLASPWSKAEIEQHRHSQQRWNKKENVCSIAFLTLVNMPLFYLAMTASWTNILIGVGVILILYTCFKVALNVALDSKYPCQIVVNGFPFVSSGGLKKPSRQTT